MRITSIAPYTQCLPVGPLPSLWPVRGRVSDLVSCKALRKPGTPAMVHIKYTAVCPRGKRESENEHENNLAILSSTTTSTTTSTGDRDSECAGSERERERERMNMRS